MVQTLSLTSLGQLGIGSVVNLELAAQMDMRIGGHIVQGHVDGTGTVVSLTPGEKVGGVCHYSTSTFNKVCGGARVDHTRRSFTDCWSH
jgi:riboflavin synthase alpha subunit